MRLKFQKSVSNAYLQAKYNILKRTPNSIISDAQGMLNALIELKHYERSQLERKIQTLESMMAKLQLKVDANKKLFRSNNKSVSLIQYRNLKRKLC